MWQKDKGRYHLVTVEQGRILTTACGRQMPVRREKQKSYPWESTGDRKCSFCSGVSAIIHTSAEEAVRYSLPRETRLSVLRRARSLVVSVTVSAAIDRRIRKLEKDAAR